MSETQEIESLKVLEPFLNKGAAQKDQAQVGEVRKFITFNLSDEHFAIHMDSVREVVLTPSISNVPQSPYYVEGVANIRGAIMPVINLEKRLNMTSESMEKLEESSKMYKYTLVGEIQGQNIGFLVDRVPSALNVNAQEVSQIDESLSTHISDNMGSYLEGIIQRDEKMIFLLNLSNIFKNKDNTPAL